MSDPIQRTSSLPLPSYQTTEGTQDPLPATSPEELKRTDNVVLQTNDDTQKSNFEDYLNQQEISIEQRGQQSNTFDTADQIRQKSIYSQPGVTIPT